MRRMFAGALAAFFALTSAAAGRPHCTLRAHAQANASDGPVFSTEIRSFSTGRKVAIEKIPTISERDVIGFRPYLAADGSQGVLLQLDDHGRLALDALSVERRGTILYVFVNNRPISEMQIDRRVSDGKLYLASGLTAADLALMRKDWRLLGPGKAR